MATAAQRTHLHNLMSYLLAHEPQIHYLQRRPMQLTLSTETRMRARLDGGGAISADCSEAVTALCKWAGLLDPSGYHFNGSGNSHTMWLHLAHYFEPARARVGAIVAFGPEGRDHVAMVYQRGTDPLLWSHGAERGPRVIRYSIERAVHRKPATCLSIASL